MVNQPRWSILLKLCERQQIAIEMLGSEPKKKYTFSDVEQDFGAIRSQFLSNRSGKRCWKPMNE